MRTRRSVTLLIVCIIVVIAIAGLYFAIVGLARELHFAHSTILNQYLYAWDKEIVSHPVRVKTTVVEDPEALGPYLMGRNPADLVEVATVFAGIAHSKNPEVKIVGSLTKAGNADSVVVVRKDSQITSPQDLKGKTVGTPGLAMTPTVLLRKLLKQGYGIEYDQVRFVLKPLPTLLTILEKGQVDAVIVFNIFAYQAALNPDLVILMDVDEAAKHLILGDYPIAAVLGSNQDTINNRRRDIERVLGAIKESHEYALLHKDEVARNLAEDFGLEIETYRLFAFRIQPANIHLTAEEKANIVLILAIAYEQGLLDQEIGNEIFW